MIEVADYRTPIHPLRYSDGQNNFYVKREDLLPFFFGGNKVRIAERYFKDMIKTGCDCIIAYGNSRSNLCRVIANMSKVKAVPCFVIVQRDEFHNRVHTYNSAIVKAMGAHIIPCDKSDVARTVGQTMDHCKILGMKPYYIYGNIYGKGNEPLAVQAYVDVYNEIIEYEKRNGVCFDYIFLPSGTGITQAGLMCGSLLHGHNRRIIGISVARNMERGYKAIADSISAYRGRQGDFAKYISFEDRYISGGYGKYNNQIVATIKHILSQDGIPLDPVYTGKAFWGMTEYLKASPVSSRNILFIHTGGLPVFFDSVVNIFGKATWNNGVSRRV